MKALVLRSAVVQAAATCEKLIDMGFQVFSVESLLTAHSLIRIDTFDLLIMDEYINGHLTHAIALSGERRNPYLSVILLSDRPADQTEDLYDLIPALYAMAGAETSVHVLARLALSAVTGQEAITARVSRYASEDAAEADAADDAVLLAAAASLDDRSPVPSDVLILDADTAVFLPDAQTEPTLAEPSIPLPSFLRRRPSAPKYDAPVLESVAARFGTDLSKRLRPAPRKGNVSLLRA